MTPLVLLLLAAQPVRFEEAVQQALSRHPAMRVADADAARARALVEQARAASLPSLGVNATGTQLDADRKIGTTITNPARQLSANVQLQVPLLAPQRWANWGRASATADATIALAADVKRQVAVSAARTWLQVLAQKRVVQATQRAWDTSNAHLEFAQSRHQAGIGSELDAIRAAQEVAVARQQHATAEGNLKKLEEQLGVAMGADDARTVEDAEPPLALPEQVDEKASERLDLKAARQRVEAARVGTRWDWTDYLPLLTLVATPGYQNPGTVNFPTWNFTGQLLLSLPLYDGGLRYGQEHERAAAQQSAEAQLEAVQRQASADVRAALEQVKQADLALQAAQEAAANARRTMELSQQAFRAGATTNIEVVDAERRARDADTAQAVAEDTARQARLEVLTASGRFP